MNHHTPLQAKFPVRLFIQAAISGPKRETDSRERNRRAHSLKLPDAPHSEKVTPALTNRATLL
jgi:hypothetical protein